MKIKSIKKQKLTLDFFLKHKKEHGYKDIRQNGKKINLSFVFGYTPFSFKDVIKEEWSLDEVNKYIKDNNLELIIDKLSGKPDIYLTVSTHLYEGYFKLYHRLKAYMKERQDLACEQGYVDCTRFPGARRHLPELMYISKDLSKDKKSHYSNLKNIAINAEAQAGEALNVYIALRKIYDEIKTRKLKSRLIGCVHDSLVFYLHKTEIKEMFYIIKNSMERFDYSIPIEAEVEIGNIWGFSPELKSKMVDSMTNDELVKYIEDKIKDVSND